MTDGTLPNGAMSELFVAIADYCNGLGIKGPGMLRFDGPSKLKCKLNATGEKQENLPPYSCLIESGGWPVGVIDPYGGVVSPINGWTEDKLIVAFNAGTIDASSEGDNDG